MRYRKDDVEFHSDGIAREQRPAVNVKVYGDCSADGLAALLRRGSTPDYYVDVSSDEMPPEWVEGLDEGTLEAYWRFALESAWEMLQSDAEELFGSHVKVRAEGRSGGWAVVNGLPDFEEWDAIMLSKWARFERWAKGGAQGIPADMLSLLYINEWESHLADVTTEAIDRAKGSVLVGG